MMKARTWAVRLATALILFAIAAAILYDHLSPKITIILIKTVGTRLFIKADFLCRLGARIGGNQDDIICDFLLAEYLAAERDYSLPPGAPIDVERAKDDDCYYGLLSELLQGGRFRLNMEEKLMEFYVRASKDEKRALLRIVRRNKSGSLFRLLRSEYSAHKDLRADILLALSMIDTREAKEFLVSGVKEIANSAETADTAFWDILLHRIAQYDLTPEQAVSLRQSCEAAGPTVKELCETHFRVGDLAPARVVIPDATGH